VTKSPYMQKLHDAMGGDLIQGPGVAAVVRDDRHRVLIIQRRDDGTWDLPAGSIEPGETSRAAIAREVKEETGLEVRVRAVAGVFSGRDFRHRYPDGQVVEAFTVVFDCDVVGGELRAVDGEATAFRYAPPDDMPPLTWPYPDALFDPARTTAVIV
jgi:ADP-ribose pyrophosphatase